MQPGVLAEHLAGFTHEFYRLKQFRHIATRNEKLAERYASIVTVGASFVWPSIEP